MPRNVLILHADQMRADGIGASGNACAITPRLDALAAQGTRFTRHIVSNPVCMPSRASLLTGLYPTAHGVWTNGVALPRAEYQAINRSYEQASGIRIVPEPPTLADVLGGAGYDTVAIGKLHLTPTMAPPLYGHPETEARWDSGANRAWHGPYYGFRHVELTSGHGEGPMRRGHYADWLERHHGDVHRRVREQKQPRPVPGLDDLHLTSVPAALHHSGWIGQRAVDYLERERPADRPFLLFCGFPDPHHPFTPSYDAWPGFADAPVQRAADPDGAGVAGHPGFMQRPFDVRGFSDAQRALIFRHTYAQVWQIDQAVGRILDALDRFGLADDTIVVFTADHGDFLCDHGLLRKWVFASDCLLRVPFLLRLPGAGLPPVVDLAMSNVDVLPTLLAATGVRGPDFVQGRDIVAAVRAGDEKPVYAFASIGHPASVNATVYDRRHRLTLFPNGGFGELFDHHDDPGEARNRAGDPGLARVGRDLHARLAEGALRTWAPNLACVSAW